MFYLLLFSVSVLVVFGFSGLLGVPFMPTHRKQTNTMMDLLNIKKGDVLIDLGSGAGRLIFAAAKRGAIVTGYELNPFLYAWTKIMIYLKGYKGQAQVFCKSLYGADVSKADFVTMFLFPQFMPPLEKKLFAECKPGAKLASYTFGFPNTKEDLKKEAIRLYTVPGDG